jgi:hypothetical protein
MTRWRPSVVAVVLAIACACGGSGGGEHALHAARVPHSVPTITVPLPTTTTAPPPPVTIAVPPPPPPPPTTAAPQPLPDCYSVVLNLWGSGWEALHHNPPADLLGESLHGAGRDDCQGLLTDDATMRQIKADFWRACRATVADPAADCPFVP